MDLVISELSRAFEPLGSMPLEVAAIRLAAALVLGGVGFVLSGSPLSGRVAPLPIDGASLLVAVALVVVTIAACIDGG